MSDKQQHLYLPTSRSITFKTNDASRVSHLNVCTRYTDCIREFTPNNGHKRWTIDCAVTHNKALGEASGETHSGLTLEPVFLYTLPGLNGLNISKTLLGKSQ